MKRFMFALVCVVIARPVAVHAGGIAREDSSIHGGARLDPSELEGEIARPGGGSTGESNGPGASRTGGGSGSHYVTRRFYGAARCPDGYTEEVTLVTADGQRTVVYSGCPQPTTSGLPPAAPAPPPPPSAEDVRRAVAMPTPGIGLDPHVTGLTGLATHLWYDGPLVQTVTVTLGAYQVTATAHATGFTWRMGDGASYSSDHPGDEAHPAATHVYDDKAPYTVTIEVTWTGTFAFTGPGAAGTGDLGQVTITGARPYRVDELQAVVGRS